MAKKPIHLEQIGGRGNRQRIWEAIRKHRLSFTCRQISAITKLHERTVQSYFQCMEAGRYIKPTSDVEPPKGTAMVREYCLVQDSGVEAPRLSKQGELLGATGNENMWRTMRIIKKFTSAQLAELASDDKTKISPHSAKTYCTFLHRAGYLMVASEARGRGNARGRAATVFAFSERKRTGPRPPMIQQTKTVYDPNLGKIVWTAEPDHDAA